MTEEVDYFSRERVIGSLTQSTVEYVQSKTALFEYSQFVNIPLPWLYGKYDFEEYVYHL